MLKLLTIILLTMILIVGCAKQVKKPPPIIKQPTKKELALDRAMTLSRTMHMSLAKIYEELKLDNFTSEEAEFAIENAQINFSENALIRAKIFKDLTGAEIRNILCCEGFTATEIDFALENLHV